MKRAALTLALVALGLGVAPPAGFAQAPPPPPEGSPEWYRAVIAATDFNCNNYADDYELKIQEAYDAIYYGNAGSYDDTLIEMSVVAAGMMNQAYSAISGAWVPLLTGKHATLQQALDWIDAKKELVQEMLDATKGLRDFWDDTSFDWEIVNNKVEYWESQLQWLDNWKSSLNRDFGPVPVEEEEEVVPPA